MYEMISCFTSPLPLKDVPKLALLSINYAHGGEIKSIFSLLLTRHLPSTFMSEKKQKNYLKFIMVGFTMGNTLQLVFDCSCVGPVGHVQLVGSRMCCTDWGCSLHICCFHWEVCQGFSSLERSHLFKYLPAVPALCAARVGPNSA